MKFSTLAVAQALAIGLFVSCGVYAEAPLALHTQELVARAQPVTMTGQVTAIDPTSGAMTVRDAGGNEVQLPVALSAARRAGPAVGDLIQLKYKDALVMDTVSHADQTRGVRSRVETAYSTPTPTGYAVSRQIEMDATVQSVDARAGRVTLRGVRHTLDMPIPADVDAKRLHPGDTVHLVFVATYAVAVEGGRG
jgi:Cu/Ag efflux protein CusF